MRTLPAAWPDGLALCLGALVVRLAAAWLVGHPGYMDAYYYFHVADNLLAGRGLVEDVAWNFLAPPHAMPRPSNAYWPPGTSAFAAAGSAALASLGAGGAGGDAASSTNGATVRSTGALASLGAGGDAAWRRAQAAPALGSALLVPGAYLMARRLVPGARSRQRALTVAGLVLLSGVYFPYWVTTDTFTPYALAGGACLWLAGEATSSRHPARLLLGAGVCAGLAQCVRPDGAALLVAPAVAAALGRPAAGCRRAWWPRLALAAAGFALGAAPWLGRNWLTWGSLTPPGVGAALWLTRYDDLFSFHERPGVELWLGAGPLTAIQARAAALVGNAAVFGQPLLYYLLPAFSYGVWRLRAERRLWPAAAYLGTLYAAMSVVVPFQSVRGGFFHSLAAALPFVLLAAVVGVEAAVAAAAARRQWHEAQAQRAFAVALVAFAALASAYFAAHLPRRWDAHLSRYRAAAGWLDAHAAGAGVVMVADPPGFWYASGRRAVVIPSDGLAALLAAAVQFEVDVLVLEPTAPRYLAGLYQGTAASPDLEYLGSIDGIRLFRIAPHLPRWARRVLPHPRPLARGATRTVVRHRRPLLPLSP